MSIYGMPYSTCIARVANTLAVKEVDGYELVPVVLSVGAHKKPEFLIMQPFGMIPMLLDSNFTNFEYRAMPRYNSDLVESPGTPFLRETADHEVVVNQGLEVESQNYNHLVSALKQHLEKMEKILDIHEAHMSKNKYFAGDLSHIPHTFDLVNMDKKGDEITSRKHVSASLKMSLKMLLKMSWKTVTAKTNAKA